MSRKIDTPSSGFTIIETMLVLSISSLLAVGIVTGVGSSINQQRYRDSVNSLASMLQREYSEVSNVRNERVPGGDELSCSSTAVITEDDTNARPRGASDCVILGRWISSSEYSPGSQTTFKISTIVGHEPESIPASASSDREVLMHYSMSVMPGSEREVELKWGAGLHDSSGATKNFRMLILRSPLSGTVHTMMHDTPAEYTESFHFQFLTASSAREDVKLCIDSNGLFTGPMRGVKIRHDASGPNGVEVLRDGQC